MTNKNEKERTKRKHSKNLEFHRNQILIKRKNVFRLINQCQISFIFFFFFSLPVEANWPGNLKN